MKEAINTKDIGNKAEIAVMCKFIHCGIPVSVPFGNSEVYDLVIDTKDGFKSVQVKHGVYRNGCVVACVEKLTGYRNRQVHDYVGLVDYLAIYCSELGTCYLVKPEESAKHQIYLRIEPPKNNSSVSTVKWAKDVTFEEVVKTM